MIVMIVMVMNVVSVVSVVASPSFASSVPTGTGAWIPCDTTDLPYSSTLIQLLLLMVLLLVMMLVMMVM